MLSEIINTIIQIIFLTSIPFTVFLIRYRTFKGFYDYIGLKTGHSKAIIFGIGASILLFIPMLVLTLLNPEFKEMMHEPSSMTGKFHLMGVSANSVVIVFITAIFKTAFAEEILFRGFITKRLIAITNFKVGNLLQSTLFGVIHLVVFLSISSNVFLLVVVFSITTLGAYVKTYLNEKKAEGSILPGWAMHATSNLLSYLIIGYYVLNGF